MALADLKGFRTGDDAHTDILDALAALKVRLMCSQPNATTAKSNSVSETRKGKRRCETPKTAKEGGSLRLGARGGVLRAHGKGKSCLLMSSLQEDAARDSAALDGLSGRKDRFWPTSSFFGDPESLISGLALISLQMAIRITRQRQHPGKATTLHFPARNENCI